MNVHLCFFQHRVSTALGRQLKFSFQVCYSIAEGFRHVYILHSFKMRSSDYFISKGLPNLMKSLFERVIVFWTVYLWFVWYIWPGFVLLLGSWNKKQNKNRLVNTFRDEKEWKKYLPHFYIQLLCWPLKLFHIKEHLYQSWNCKYWARNNSGEF